jgi:PHP family Zn ribbon phosphoesterase
MPKIIADFHVHSAYSRATSKEMNVDSMALWAKKKGITLLGTGDFTHPAHLRELKEKLKPAGNGLYTTSPVSSVFFIPTAEISSIYTCKGKVRKVHSLVIAPGIEIAEKINNTLQKHGNLSSDGRKIVSLFRHMHGPPGSLFLEASQVLTLLKSALMNTQNIFMQLRQVSHQTPK